MCMGYTFLDGNWLPASHVKTVLSIPSGVPSAILIPPKRGSAIGQRRRIQLCVKLHLPSSSVVSVRL